MAIPASLRGLVPHPAMLRSPSVQVALPAPLKMENSHTLAEAHAVLLQSELVWTVGAGGPDSYLEAQTERQHRR